MTTRLRTRSARSPLRPRRCASRPPPRRATPISAATTSKPAYALFDTPIDRCALVWRGGAIIGAALPEPSDEVARERLARRFPEAAEASPPAPIRQAVDAVVRLLSGERLNLASIEVDLAATDAFERSVYAVTRSIPPGEIRTYGEVAASLGSPGAARAVGRALGRNPIPIIIPCHRVLAAAGGSGGFSAPGGTDTKFRMLAIEGARRSGEPELFDDLPLAVKRPSAGG